ncbi:MAG: hypothetical protein ABFD90_02320 [Phycisphaerales bacterium]
MKTWIVVTEIFLLGLWIDDWGLAIEGAVAHPRRAIHDPETNEPTHLQTTFSDSSNNSFPQKWTCPLSVRPPPLRE